MKFPQIGEVLPSGHTVYAAYCIGQDRYVIAHRDDAPQPYVVWDVDQDGDTYNGRYFADPIGAQKHFAWCCYDWLDGQKSDQNAADPTDYEIFLIRNALAKHTTSPNDKAIFEELSFKYGLSISIEIDS